MVERVALVIVSHSPHVAQGTADMVRQMVGDEVQVAHCGGDPGGGLGTDVATISRAIDSVFSPAASPFWSTWAGRKRTAKWRSK